MFIPASQILTRLAENVNKTWDTLDSNMQALFKRAMQQGYYNVCLAKTWDSLRTRGTITLTPAYTTGTVAVTQGSANVAGTGVVWADAMAGRNIIIGSSGYLYRVARVMTPSDLTIDPPYIDADASGLTYYILKSVYDLPADFGFMLGNTLALLGTNPMKYVSRVEGPAYSVGRGTDVGDPEKYSDAGTRRSTYHSCAVTIASSVVTGTGFTDLMDGLLFCLDGESQQYTFVYVNATKGSLSPDYVNPDTGTDDNAVSTMARLGPRGAPQIEFYPHPEVDDGDPGLVEFWYQRVPKPLLYVETGAGSVQQDDRPELPVFAHQAVYAEALAVLISDFSEGDDSAVARVEKSAAKALQQGMSKGSFTREPSRGVRPAPSFLRSGARGGVPKDLMEPDPDWDYTS